MLSILELLAVSVSPLVGWELPQAVLGVAGVAAPHPPVPPPPALLEGGGPHPLVPLEMAEVSPGSGAPPRSPPPGGNIQPPRLEGGTAELERLLLAAQGSESPGAAG